MRTLGTAAYFAAKKFNGLNWRSFFSIKMRSKQVWYVQGSWMEYILSSYQYNDTQGWTLASDRIEEYYGEV